MKTHRFRERFYSAAGDPLGQPNPRWCVCRSCRRWTATWREIDSVWELNDITPGVRYVRCYPYRDALLDALTDAPEGGCAA